MTEAEWLSGTDPAPMLSYAERRLTDRQRLRFVAACCRRIWKLLTDHRFRRVVEVAEAVADGRATLEELAAARHELPRPGNQMPRAVVVPHGDRLVYSGEFIGQGGTFTLDFNQLPAWCQETYSAVVAIGLRQVDVVPSFCASAAGYHAGDQVSERHPLRENIRRLREAVRRGYEKAEEYHRRGAERLATETGEATRALELDTQEQITRLEGKIRAEAEAVRKRRIVEEKAAQAGLLRCLLGNPFRRAKVDPRWLTADVVNLVRGIDADSAFDRLPILADALQDAGCEKADILGHCRTDPVHTRGCWIVELLRTRG
jgi:hypothetical protein